MPDVVIVNSGVANLASIAAGLQRLGASAAITDDPETVRSAERVVLPGVGAFGPGRAALSARGLDTAVRDVIAAGTPFLAICLGLQLLCEGSDESPGVPGLGAVPGVCRRLPDSVRVPHLGWNRIVAQASGLLRPGVAAFANSYALCEAPAGWRTAWATHGRPFVAALERDAVLACQFHPELSGAFGAELLERWLALEGAASAPASREMSGLLPRIIACLDVRDGRVVKGVQFQGLRDAGDPADQAARYESQGADEIVVLDVAASVEGRATQLETVRRVRASVRIPLTAGGGVRSVDDARCLLAAGADKVTANTAAVRRPELITELAEEYGSQCIVTSIDARRSDAPGRWDVLVLGGREPASADAVAWAREAEQRGAGEILLTSWDRDGTRAGHDLELLGAVVRAVRVPVIASGGIGTRAHIAEALAAGAAAVLTASVLHDRDDTIGGIKADLASRHIRVRQ